MLSFHLAGHGGLVTLTLTGSGLSDAMTVTVCGKPCEDVQGGHSSSATCLLPPSGG